MHACVACACVGKLYWCAHTLNVPIKLQWFNVEALTSFLLVYQSCSQRHTCPSCCSRYVVALDSRSSSSNRARRSSSNRERRSSSNRERRSSSNRERRSSSNRAQRCSSNGAKEQQRERAAARTSSSERARRSSSNRAQRSSSNGERRSSE